MMSKVMLEEMLGIREMPSYFEALRDENALRQVCCALYGRDEKDILKIDLSHSGNPCRAEVEFTSSPKAQFYLKKSREGVMNECAGMTVVNILLGRELYRFATDGKKTLVMEEITGKVFNNIKANSKELSNPDTARSYGEARGISNALGLGDRHDLNVLLTEEKEVVNIDFGQIFFSNRYKTLIGNKAPEGLETEIRDGEMAVIRQMRANLDANRTLLRKIATYAFFKAKTTRSPFPLFMSSRLAGNIKRLEQRLPIEYGGF